MDYEPYRYTGLEYWICKQERRGDRDMRMRYRFDVLGDVLEGIRIALRGIMRCGSILRYSGVVGQELRVLCY